MKLHSCLYEGTVRHRRFHPVENHFSYKIYMSYIDLAELPTLFDRFWLWSRERFNLATFRRADYHGPQDKTLEKAVRDTVESETGNRPTGPIRLMSHLRYFGYIFNPVSFYFVYNDSDTQLDYILTEITNTPWHERRSHVLKTNGDARQKQFRFSFRKDFHVSPFLSMDYDYQWRFTKPGNRFAVHMENHQDNILDFDATMTMKRTPMTSANMARVLVNYPFMTGKVVSGIYWQALKLWLKGATFYNHPKVDNRLHGQNSNTAN